VGVEIETGNVSVGIGVQMEPGRAPLPLTSPAAACRCSAASRELYDNAGHHTRVPVGIGPPIILGIPRFAVVEEKRTWAGVQLVTRLWRRPRTRPSGFAKPRIWSC
jgi:hypothetical protein